MVDRKRKRIGTRCAAERQAFTLIELLLVMVILAVLAAVIVPNYARRANDARIARAIHDVANLKTLIQAYEIDTAGTYPQSLNDLVSNPGGASAASWHGPYVESLPKDPWGRDYIYHPPTGGDGGTSYSVLSAGPDGQEGTADDVPAPASK